MEPLAVLVIAGVTLVVSGLAVSALPVQQCDECEHCRRLKLEREIEQRRLSAEYARRWGIRRTKTLAPVRPATTIADRRPGGLPMR